MRHSIRNLLLLILSAVPLFAASPTITVSGTSVSLLNSSNPCSITVSLIDPNNTGMLKAGSSIVTGFTSSTVTPAGTCTVGPIWGQDVVLDAFGNANSTYYKVQVFLVTNGIIASTPALQAFYAFTGSGTIDLSTATPLAPSFMTGTSGNVTVPGNFSITGQFTGNTTFTGNETFSGSLTAGSATVSGGGSLGGTFTGGQTFTGGTKSDAFNVSTRGDRQVILQNPDFEGSSLIFPPGWTNANATTTGEVSYETSTPAPGKLQSVKLATTVKFHGLQTINSYSVVPGDTYTASVAAKTDGTGSAFFVFAFLDKNGSSAGVSSADILLTTTSTSWVTLTGSTTVPANAAQVLVQIENNSNTQPSTVWFDQISVQKLNFPGNVTTAGLTSTAGAIVAGPSPWIDVTAPAYGAKCDGTTDDTTAINNALAAAAAANSGTAFIPTGKTCKFTSTLTMGSSGVTLASEGNPTFAAGVNPTALLYTGTASPAVDAKGSGNTIKNLQIAYNNASFVGTLVSTDAGTLSQHIKFENVNFLGISVKTAAQLVSLNNTTNVDFDKCVFNGAVTAIRGTNGGFSNRVRIVGSFFSGGTGNFTGNLITNPGQGWKISGNTFELLGFANTQTAIDASTAGCEGCSIEGNWLGDAPAAYSGSVIKTGAANGTSVSGNTFLGGSSNLATTINVASGANGLSVTGNFFGNFANGVQLNGSNQQGVFVHGNWLGSVTTFISGTPSNGIAEFGAVGGTASSGQTLYGGGTMGPGIAVGSLPSAASNPGLMMYVTDSTAITAEGQACVGSSTNKALAFSNGSAWKCF